MIWPFRVIGEYEAIRWWEGIAWERYYTRTAVLAPIGLHRLAGLVRQAWFDYKTGHYGEHALDLEFTKGYKLGQTAAEEREVRRRVDVEVERFYRIAVNSGMIRPARQDRIERDRVQ